MAAAPPDSAEIFPDSQPEVDDEDEIRIVTDATVRKMASTVTPVLGGKMASTAAPQCQIRLHAIRW